MKYRDIYNKLGNVVDTGGGSLTKTQRIRYTIKIANCPPMLREEILNYLDTEQQPDYMLKLTFKDPTTGRPRTSVVTCMDVQNNLLISPLAALLFMDFLRRNPELASALTLYKDTVDVGSRESFLKHVDPALRVKAEEIIRKREAADTSWLDDQL